MYKTMEYARVICSKCGKEVQKLMPGKVFSNFKECECQVVKPKRTPRKKKSNDTI